MRDVHFRQGDRVRFRMADRTVQGLVKEDRGPIGIGGRHLYLVEFRTEPESPAQIELPAEELQPSRAAAAAN